MGIRGGEGGSEGQLIPPTALFCRVRILEFRWSCVDSGRQCKESWVLREGHGVGRRTLLGEGREESPKGDRRLSNIAPRGGTMPVLFTPVPDTAPGIQWVLNKCQRS